MAEELRLEYLGGMQITRGGAPLTGFVSTKAPALLCYLALTARPQFRLVLAGLLWGDLPEADACANLRKVLSNLRNLVGANLIITPQTVAFDRRSSYWLDVEAFLDRIDQETRKQGNKETTQREITLSTPSLSTSARSAEPGRACLPELRAAADLYRGDFLDGFYVRNAPTFEEWVLGQRERLQQSALRVFQVLASHHASRGEHAAALDFTSRLLVLDPWQEEAHRQMMALLAHSGQRSAALAQYETCRRLLKNELGIEPTAETTALYRRIRAIGAPRPHNLPTPATSFVGREDELSQIAGWLADPGCRLLTILGPGGVGKTRLALQAALGAKDRADDTFQDGIHFVSLHSVCSASALASALTGAVGLLAIPGTESHAELLRFLRGKEILLVLDGFEHLVGEAGLLSAILQHAPQVKLLVTSRQRLNLTGEWPLELGGLPYAPLGQKEGVAAYSATQLFLQRARQACPGLEPSALDYQAITYICELVEGLPLAIELAAAWARSMSCLEIAQAVESGLEALTAFMRDSPPRHQSLRASFEHSWNLLSAREKQVLRRLAVFRGGFTRATAEKIAGADMAVLVALTDKSLLRRDRAGRYDLHALLRQYAGERLREMAVEEGEAHSRHARCYLGEFLPRREQELRGGRQREALDRFREELGNVQAAWMWAVAHGMSEEISGSLLPLAILYEMLGWWREGEAAFRAAADGWGADLPETDEVSRAAGVVAGAVLATHGSFCLRTGAFDRARVQLQAGLEALQQAPDCRKEKAFPHMGLGLLANSEGRPADAEEHFRRSLAILRTANDLLLTAFALDYLGEICAAQGKPDEARRLLEEALALHREHGEQWGVGRALYGLGQVAAGLGEQQEARRCLGESLSIFTTLGARIAAARARSALGEVVFMAGEYPQARSLLEESLPVLEESRNSLMAARCRVALGRVACALGQHERADAH